MLVSFLPREFLLHIPCWFHFYLGSFYYTARAGLIFIREVSLIHPMLFFMRGVARTHPILPSFLCGEFLLHIPCCLDFYAGSFSYISDADFIYLGSFSYTSRAGFNFISDFSYTPHAGFILSGEVSLTHPVLASFLSGEFLLHTPRWLHFYADSFLYIPC